MIVTEFDLNHGMVDASNEKENCNQNTASCTRVEVKICFEFIVRRALQYEVLAYTDTLNKLAQFCIC